MAASQSSNVEIIKLLLSHGADINRGDDSPLAIAVKNKLLENVKVLVENGANISEFYFTEQSILCVAADYFVEDIMRYLIEQGAACKYQALDRCMGSKDLRPARLLLEAGASVTSDGRPYKLSSSAFENIESVKLVVEFGVGIEDAFYYAVSERKADIAEYLIDHGANINHVSDNGISILSLAICENYMEILPLLFKKGVKTDQRHREAWFAMMERKPKLSKFLFNFSQGIVDRKFIVHKKEKCTDEEQFELARFLIENGADLNAKNVNDESALLIASKNNNFEFIKYLMEKGVDRHDISDLLLNAVSKRKMTLLKFLVENGSLKSQDDVEKDGFKCLLEAVRLEDTEIAEYLIRQGVPLNSPIDFKNLPLIEAADRGHIEMVQWLLKHGADINAANFHGSTALIEASKTGKIDMVKFLVESGAFIDQENKEKETALYIAVKYRKISVVEYFIDEGANINQTNDKRLSILDQVICKNYTEILPLLFKKGVKLDSRHKEAWVAMMDRKIRLGKFMFDYSQGKYNECFDFNENESCTNEEQLDFARFLVENGADLLVANLDGENALSKANSQKNEELIRYLMIQAADCPDFSAFTDRALTSAVFKHEWPLIEILVERGALQSQKQREEEGFLWLSLIARNGNIEMAEFVVEKGVPVSLHGTFLLVPLMEATLYNQIEMVRWLLEHGADVDGVDCDGYTALMGASEYGFFRIAKLLIERGASVDKVNNASQTALYIATCNSRRDIVKLLQERMN